LLPQLGLGPAAPEARQTALDKWFSELAPALDLLEIGAAVALLGAPREVLPTATADDVGSSSDGRVVSAIERTAAAIHKILVTLTPDELTFVGVADEGRNRCVLDLSKPEIERLLTVQRRRLGAAEPVEADGSPSRAESSEFVEVSDEAGDVMADLMELEEALASERQELELIRRVIEIDIKEEIMYPSAAAPMSPESRGASPTDKFSEHMTAVGLEHTNREGEHVVLKATDLPEVLDLFHLPNDLAGAGAGAGTGAHVGVSTTSAGGAQPVQASPPTEAAAAAPAPE